MTQKLAIKLCGLRREEDIAYANEARPDYIGFVFTKSRRQISAARAAELRKELKGDIRTVGVFVNADLPEVAAAARLAALDAVQLHGDEDEAFVKCLRTLLPHLEIWRAIRVQSPEGILKTDFSSIDKLVLDAYSPTSYGGTGKKADWTAIRAVRDKIPLPFLLAGGLTAENVCEAAQAVSPFGVDLSSGIETNGTKDPVKIKNLFTVLGR